MINLVDHRKYPGRETSEHVAIAGIDNLGTHEAVRIVNRSMHAQALAGWALAGVRGKKIFFFPSGVVLDPQKVITVHSGSATPNDRPNGLFWTDELIWSNAGGDLAVLFNADGNEVARFAYPDALAIGRLAEHRKRLLHSGETYHIVDVLTE